MWDIINCRTETMGGHVYQCLDCHETQYRYHSCQNRHCPKCMNDRAEKWLEKQKALLLPANYHFLTFTLPEELRAVARSNQKTIYRILFKASSESLKKLAADERYAGGMIGMTGVLHTWRRDMLYHPHVHYIVPGGGYDTENNQWRPASAKFFVPVLALSIILRAKFRDEMKKAGLTDKVPEAIWKKDWVVHSKPAGDGKHALKSKKTELLRPFLFQILAGVFFRRRPLLFPAGPALSDVFSDEAGLQQLRQHRAILFCDPPQILIRLLFSDDASQIIPGVIIPVQKTFVFYFRFKCA